MRLVLNHPIWAARSCDDCEKYLWNEDGSPHLRGGRLHILRPKGVATPCQKCPKIPPQTEPKCRKSAVELNAKNRQAYQHYLECRAVGRFPDDSIVRRNAAIIRAELDWFERQELRVPLLDLVRIGRAFVR